MYIINALFSYMFKINLDQYQKNNAYNFRLVQIWLFFHPKVQKVLVLHQEFWDHPKIILDLKKDKAWF